MYAQELKKKALYEFKMLCFFLFIYLLVCISKALLIN